MSFHNDQELGDDKQFGVQGRSPCTPDKPIG